MSYLKEAAKITDLASGDVIKRGSYKGMSERQRFLLKTIPSLKPTYSLFSLAQEKKTYDHYNSKSVDSWRNPAYYFIKKEIEKNEK